MLKAKGAVGRRERREIFMRAAAGSDSDIDVCSFCRSLAFKCRPISHSNGETGVAEFMRISDYYGWGGVHWAIDLCIATVEKDIYLFYV
jgi:hypothetical protein